MAVEAFLKLGDLKGESQIKGFEDQIQILSWSWGLSQSGTTHMGTGGGSGKVNVQDMSLTHYVDTASPNIVGACCQGKHFDEAVLLLRKAGGDEALEYLTITLTEVIVTSVSVGGSEGDPVIVENFSLNFGKFKYSYQPQDEKGAKGGGTVDYEGDIAKAVWK